nr:cation-translocating P-type ATPase [Maliibacterium massiliense]
MKKQAVTPIPSQAVERYASTAQAGLTRAQAAARAAQHLDNRAQSARTKSISCIVRDNVCTLFNLINLVLAVAILAVGSYKNAMFIGVVLCNMAIGIIQEVRAKRTVDKLSLMSAVKAHVVREGACMDIAREDVVLDDVLALKSGGEVAADALVLEGACDVNESFVTGEADAVHKKAGDTLLAGSFVVSGTCRARVEHVGNDTYIAGISRDAKRLRMATSEIMGTLKKIIKIISIVIIPVGAILLWNQLTMSHNSIQDAVVQTAAALIGMIPEGLMLLTSTVLAVSVVRLSKHKVLVQELYCIENLARVDTLCLDKTGTLTEGVMEVSEVLPLAGQSQSACMRALAALACACSDKNATMQAIAQRVGQQSDWSCQLEVPFSSDTKWSGAVFAGRGSYVLGAPEFVLGDMPDALRALVNQCGKTSRVVLLARSDAPIAQGTLPQDMEPLALVLIQDRIRPQAKDTLAYFAQQDVDIKVISGDNVATVSGVAARAGIKHWERAVDASTLTGEEALAEAAERYCVFGRVTPPQKKALVAALQKKGHTVAMTGDGVNDVPALKEADCSVVMASGSDAARNIAQLVLMDSNFDAMPRVVAEGRRSVNNIQRSASLFLVKTIYATVLALLFVFVRMPYPFEPIQMTLVNVVTIGIPSFVLALEPNRARIQGSFLGKVILRAVPGALTIVCNITAMLILTGALDIAIDQYSTMCLALTGFTGLLVVLKNCLPPTPVRMTLFGAMCAAFALGMFILYDLFSLAALTPMLWALLIGMMAVSALLFVFFTWLFVRRMR